MIVNQNLILQIFFFKSLVQKAKSDEYICILLFIKVVKTLKCMVGNVKTHVQATVNTIHATYLMELVLDANLGG